MKNLQTDDRRGFLKTTLAVGAGMVVMNGLAAPAFAADTEPVSKPGDAKPVTTGELFGKGVIGPAELSLITSKLAVEKATQANTKEFATFELGEAVAVTTVLKEMGITVPAPDSMAVSIIEKLKAAPKGKEFDQAFIAAQLANHEFLRDHAADYLKRSESKAADMTEMHVRHLAILNLAVFKEHVAICQRIATELKA